MSWRRKNRKSTILGTGTLLLTVILAVSTTRILAPHFLSGSSSYFYDQASSSGDTLGAGWKIPSTITCSVSTSGITLGNSVTISGDIDPGRSAQVTIEYSLDSGAWTSLATVTSASDGSYSQGWTPPSAGSYEIKASWAGDSYYFGDTSGTVTLTVTVVP